MSVSIDIDCVFKNESKRTYSIVRKQPKTNQNSPMKTTFSVQTTKNYTYRLLPEYWTG